MEIVKLGVILSLICGIAAGSLQFVHSLTEPVIEENARLAAIEKRKMVLPDAEQFVEERFERDGKSMLWWRGMDGSGKQVGAVIEVSPKGYSGAIKTTIGINPDSSIRAVAINKLDQSETPGLGTKIIKDSFRKQFVGKKGDALKLKKDGGEIDAITAATISSRAVANGVKKGWEWYMKAQVK